MPRQEKPKQTNEPGKPRKSDQSPPGNEGKRRKPRFKPETLAQRAVARAQKETCQYIPYTTFDRLVHEILAQNDESSKVYMMKKEAVQALWTESEAMLVDVFRASNVTRATGGRMRLTGKHIRSTLQAADIVNRTDHFRRVWNRPEGAPPPHIKSLEPVQQQVNVISMQPAGKLQTMAEMKASTLAAKQKASTLSQVDASQEVEKCSLLDLARAEEKRATELKEKRHQDRLEQARRAVEQRQRSLQPIVTDVVRIMQKVINK